MAYGSGGSDYEQRILNLERMLNTPRLASVEQRLGAVEQQQWQTANPGGGGGLIVVIRTATTPTGGIPAKSGSTCGSASCTFENIAAGAITTDNTATVYNRFTSVVGATAGTPIVVGWCVNVATGDGCWVVIAENC
jgi:hypothetical protein